MTTRNIIQTGGGELMPIPKIRLIDTETRERFVKLRMPFKFGIVTLREAPQLFLKVRIRTEDGRESEGIAAEMLAPKWFDKNPELSNEENFEQLRETVAIAAGLYLDAADAAPAFQLHAQLERAHLQACGEKNLNALTAGFGTALVDRAIIDAIGRLEGQSVFTLVQNNRLGIDHKTAPDLEGFDLDEFFQTLKPANTIAARHTVGLVDAITEADIPDQERVGDGLPESLEAAIDTYDIRYFKLKVGGDIDADLDRLRRIAAVLDRSSDAYFATLDGNEQYESAEPVIELWQRIEAEPLLSRLRDSILFIEQPIMRAKALERNIADLSELKPVEIDESDAAMGEFLVARDLGYTGISSKSCKGFYRSLLNRARVEMWNNSSEANPYFMSAEDLTTQAGIAVQQDLALATLIGCTHVERNGHHYVDGMKGIPEEEQHRFLEKHGDLYSNEAGHLRLLIKHGKIALGSLETPGLGSAVIPDLSSMSQ